MDSAEVPAVLLREDVCTLLSHFVGLSLAPCMWHQVCRKWRGFFGAAARRSAGVLLPSPREVMTVQVGGCGIRLGHATWQLYCLEHGLMPNGSLQDGAPEAKCMASFFGEMLSGRWRPRSIFVDVESDAIDEVRRAPCALFNPAEMVCGKGSSGGLFSTAYYGVGKTVFEEAIDAIRRLAEDCGSLNGFIIPHAVARGAGAGLTALLLERLAVDFGKISKLSISIFNGQGGADSTPEPYNCVLSMRALIQSADITLVLENAKLSQICRGLNLSDDDRVHPAASFAPENSLSAVALSSLTESMRFGPANVDLGEIQCHMVPFPSIHFLLASFAPLAPSRLEWRIDGADLIAVGPQLSVAEITSQVFEPSSFFATCDPRHGKYMACALYFRGDVVPKDVHTRVATIKTRRDIQFVDWTAKGCKCSISERRLVVSRGLGLAPPARAVFNLGNMSCVGEIFSRCGHSFDTLWSQRSFVHRLVSSGMEEGELVEAREALAELERDYEEATAETADEEDDEDEF